VTVVNRNRDQTGCSRSSTVVIHVITLAIVIGDYFPINQSKTVQLRLVIAI